MQHQQQRQTWAGRVVGCAVGLAAMMMGSTGDAQALMQTPVPGAEVVVEWNDVAYRIAWAEDEFGTFKGQRALAMMNLAMHDALNTIEPRYERYAYEGVAVGAAPELAAAHAAHAVLLAQYPTAAERLDRLLANRPGQVGQPALQEASAELGRAAAAAILLDRERDGWDAPGTYTFTEREGRYRTTPEWNGFVLQPGFRNARPFAMNSADAFRPPPPPALSDEGYRRDVEEVKAYGAKDSDVRTADQTAYAVWWMEFSEGSVTRLTRRLSLERGSDVWEAARLFAHLSMALYDVYIATWDSKYEYDHWRPYTAIRHAPAVGSAGPVGDAKWESLLPAPPFPEYVSAHAAGCSAAFAVLSSMWGENVEFTMTTITAPPDMASRRFGSFREAAAECADSRVRLGWHFRYSTEAGLDLGEQVAAHVLGTQLRPVRQ
jgi:hypothetical protein